MRKYGRTLYILFNSKLFVDFKQWSYEKRWNRTDTYPHEEVCISQRLLHISSNHSRTHHSERHQTCADSVMRGGIFSLRDIIIYVYFKAFFNIVNPDPRENLRASCFSLSLFTRRFGIIDKKRWAP